MKNSTKKIVLNVSIVTAFFISILVVDLNLKSVSNHLQLKTIEANETLRQLDCLTKNIYWEARGEPVAGKIAVAQVTLNRVNDSRFEDTICGVVYERTKSSKREICQFSWVCSVKNQMHSIDPKHYEEHRELAKKVLFENIRIPQLKDALYFHGDYVNPGWNKKRITKIGKHIFYREHEGSKNERK